MKPADVRKQIKSGETAPLYLLEGDDLQSRHDLAVEFAELVDEGLQAFNLQSFYANEATTAALREQMIADILVGRAHAADDVAETGVARTRGRTASLTPQGEGRGCSAAPG